jgi:uncharacterized membrane protein YjdF
MALSLDELVEREKSNCIRSWALVVLIALSIVYNLLTAGYVGAVLGVGVILAVLIPTVAYRSYRTILVWEVLFVAATALITRELLRYQPIELLGNYLVIAAISLIITVELYLYTHIEMNRWFAVVFVAMVTMTVGTVWNLGQWALDLTVGTTFIPGNDQLMIELIAATAAGVAAGFLFIAYFRQRSTNTAHPSVTDPKGEPRPDNEESPELRERRDPMLSDRLSISKRHQRYLVRLLQLGLVAMGVYGLFAPDIGLLLTSLFALTITALPNILEGKYDVPIGVGLTLWITVGVFLHTLGTGYFYGRSFWFHNLAHAISGSLIAAIGYATFRAVDEHTSAVRFPPTFMAVLILLFVVSIGVFWEILEFTTDLLLVTESGEGLVFVQYGLADTMSDLFFDLIGGILVALWGTASLTGVAAGVRNQLDE